MKRMKRRDDNILRHARMCAVCKERIDDIKQMLGMELGVRKRGRKSKNP